MYMKSIAAGLAASALLVTVASAQDPMKKTDNMTTSEQSVQGDWRTSKVVGLDVYNDKNDSIGSINDLLTDKSGNIKAVVLGVGGLLGVGEHLVAVPYDRIKFVNQPVSSSSTSSTTAKPATTTGTATTSNGSTTSKWYPDHAVFNATKDELKAMPEFKYSN